MILLFVFGLLLAGEPVWAEPRWASLARQVGHNESSRNEALKELRKIQNLNSVLVEALDSDQRALALDAISALSMKSLIPLLLTKIKQDEDGYLTLCLNSLFDSTNKDKLLTAYARRLSRSRQSQLSPGAIVALLEPLGRLSKPLPVHTLQSLLNHKFPEVRQAALHYVKTTLLRDWDSTYDSVIGKAITDPSFQVRLQAYSLLNELKSQSGFQFPVSGVKLRILCRLETYLAVRKVCQSLFIKKSGG